MDKKSENFGKMSPPLFKSWHHFENNVEKSQEKECVYPSANLFFLELEK